MQRTVRLKLQTTPEQAPILADTLAGVRAYFDAVAAHGWAEEPKRMVWRSTKPPTIPFGEDFPISRPSW